MNLKKVLVITLYCGEPQLDACMASVAAQQGVALEHVLIKHKPNVEAHRELYEIINARSSEFDYFLKLDADMTLVDDHALVRLLARVQPDTDIFSFSVFDYFTGSDIPAAHIYSNRVTFKIDTMDDLYPDMLEVEYPGRKHFEKDTQRNVRHAFEPTAEQAFLFGLHRALKVVQAGRNIINIASARFQMRVLQQVYQQYTLKPDEEGLRYAMAGASLVLSRHVVQSQMQNKAQYQDLFKAAQGRHDSNVSSCLSKRELIAVQQAVGLPRFWLSMPVYLFRKLFKIT